MSLTTSYDSDWEWGWKTPLLLFSGTESTEVEAFLASPLTEFDLKAASRHLDESLAKLKTSRIGIRFERIQEALMRAHPKTASLRAGIQIPGVTEIDLLHKLHSLPDTSIHWEVAVKFYLAIDPKGSKEPSRWIGPSLQDTLGIKMRTIRERQLCALKDPKVRTSLGIPETEKIIAIPKVHGVLFVPWRPSLSLHSFTDRLESPDGVVPESGRGLWIRESDADAFLSALRDEHGSSLRIFILQDRKEWIRSHTRGEWLTPGVGLPEILNSEKTLKDYFNFRLKKEAPGSPPEKEPLQGMLILKEESRVSEFRFFCVPDAWLDHAEGALETLKPRSRIKE